MCECAFKGGGGGGHNLRSVSYLTLISEFLASFMEIQFDLGRSRCSLTKSILGFEQNLFNQNSEGSPAVMIKAYMCNKKSFRKKVTSK